MNRFILSAVAAVGLMLASSAAMATGSGGSNNHGGNAEVDFDSTIKNTNTAEGGNATGGNVNLLPGSVQGGDGGNVLGSGNSANFNNNTANGGAGGQGGTGLGVGVGIGQGGDATGGSVDNSGNSTVDNTNVGVNLNKVDVDNTVKVGVDNTVKTKVNVDNTDTNSNLQGQFQGQGQEQSTENANNSSQNVTVEGDTYEAPEIPVSTAYSAPLTSGEDTCMGSSSLGAQGMMFGVSIGTTWQDENCMDLKWYREFQSSGLNQAAVALACQSNSGRNVAALAAAGIDCGALKQNAVAMIEKNDEADEASVVTASVSSNERPKLFEQRGNTK